MAFSREQDKKNAIAMAIRQAKAQVQGEAKNDTAFSHPDWVRDAVLKKYTQLTIDVTKQMKDYQEMAIKRRLKRVGK